MQKASEPDEEPEPIEISAEDAPSDVDEAGAEGSTAGSATLKDSIRAEVGAGLTGGVSPNRAVIGENLLALEASNPTATPASSPLLNGRWKFLYASGASPSLGALRTLMRGAARAPKSPSGAELVDVEDAYLTINSVQPRATSSVKVRVLSLESELKLTSTLEPESAVRLVETYDGFESGTGNLRLPLGSTPRKYSRSLLVSYLDEELLVVRDAAGRPDILSRCAEVEWAPSSITSDETDESAPGAS